jgi:hypothetical protein
MLILVASLLPCCLAALLLSPDLPKTQNNCPSLLSTLPTRENVLAPGYQRISWPPSPKPPATRTCPLINMIQPVSPVSLSEHTHLTVQSSAHCEKNTRMFFLRPSTSEWPAHPPHPRLIPPSQLAFTPYQPPSSPVLHFIKIFNLLGIFWAFRPAYATFGSPRHPSFALFYFFSFNLCSQFIK